MTLEKNDKTKTATRRLVLGSAAVLAAGSAMIPSKVQACHTYPGGCGKYRRDQENKNTQSTSVGGTTETSSSSGGCAYFNKYVGCHVNAGGVGNYVLRQGADQALRFKAEATGIIRAVRWFNKYDHARPGYHFGNGGDLIIEMRTELDGSVIARSDVIRSPLSIGQFPKIYFNGGGASVRQGVVYYLYFRNISGSGAVSLNHLHSYANNNPRSSWNFWGDILAVYRREKGAWVIKTGHIPIFEIFYNNGFIGGNGYIQGNRSNPGIIDGKREVRQNFVAGYNMSVQGAWVRAYQTSISTSNLSILIMCENGKVHARGQISRSSVTVAPGDDRGAPSIRWNFIRFDKRASLTKGTRYFVVLQARRGGNYRVLTTQNAYHYFGFREAKLWRNARGEFSSDGKSWRGFTMHGSTNRPDCDLGILLKL